MARARAFLPSEAAARQDAVQSIAEGIGQRNHVRLVVPSFIRDCLAGRYWEQERESAMGKVSPMPFDQFVTAKPPAGLGSTFEEIEDVIFGHPDAVRLWEEVTGRAVREPVVRAGALSLDLERIRLDGGTQSRAELNEATVEEYAEHVDLLPPVIVFYDGTVYWLADGFHRVAGHKKAGRSEIKATVAQGTQRDAILYSVGANAKHGLRRTNADKRRAVELLLRDEEWSKKSDRWIAEQCGVDHKFVGKIRGEQLGTVPSSTAPTERTGQDGKTRKLPDRKASDVTPDDVAKAKQVMAEKPLPKPLVEVEEPTPVAAAPAPKLAPPDPKQWWTCPVCKQEFNLESSKAAGWVKASVCGSCGESELPDEDEQEPQPSPPAIVHGPPETRVEQIAAAIRELTTDEIVVLWSLTRAKFAEAGIGEYAE